MLLALAGAVIGFYLLLFVTVNQQWTVVRLPNLPWSASPSWPAFEAQTWWLMTASIVAGAAAASIVSGLLWCRAKRRFASDRSRIVELTEEINSLNRMLSAIDQRK